MRIVLFALMALPSVASAGAFQLFTYHNNAGKVRICKGDTTTGEAVCVDGASAWTDVAGKQGRPETWTETQATRRFLKYRTPFKVAAPDRYQFFVYYNTSNKLRLCAGDTADGVAVCFSGADAWADHPGPTEASEYTIDTVARSEGFKYFWSEGGKVGDYVFSSYQNNERKSRVCRMKAATAETLCATGTNVSASATGPRPDAPWQTQDSASVTYFRY